MPRKVRYPARRMVRLTDTGDLLLIKISAIKETLPAELAREYVEAGIRRDRKLVEDDKDA